MDGASLPLLFCDGVLLEALSFVEVEVKFEVEFLLDRLAIVSRVGELNFFSKKVDFVVFSFGSARFAYFTARPEASLSVSAKLVNYHNMIFIVIVLQFGLIGRSGAHALQAVKMVWRRALKVALTILTMSQLQPIIVIQALRVHRKDPAMQGHVQLLVNRRN